MQTHCFLHKRPSDEDVGVVDVSKSLATYDRIERHLGQPVCSGRRIAVYRKLGAIRDARRAEQGDVWHCLQEVATGKVLKFVAMGEAEAERRNKVVSDTGYRWLRRSP